VKAIATKETSGMKAMSHSDMEKQLRLSLAAQQAVEEAISTYH
jgi:hypothetical protein